MSRGEGELLTVPKPRAVRLLSVYLAVKPVGEPDAGDRHVRFDERGWETERCRMAQATAPILDSTNCDIRGALRNGFDADITPIKKSFKPIQCCLQSMRTDMQGREFTTLISGAREVLMQKFMLIAVVGMSPSSR